VSPLDADVPAAPRLASREGGVALALLAGAWLLLAASDDWLLLRHRYWMDELCCTVYALRDASNPIELFRYATRYDVAPPLLHFLIWPFTKLAGYEPQVVRSVTLACAVAATWLLYLVLRRRFGRMASAGAVVGVASHTLLLHHAFDARFYAPWLLFAVAYAWSLGVDAGQPSRRRDVLLALFAVCLCTIHWFGVTSLFLLAAGAVAAHGTRWRAGVRLVAPSVAGVVVLVALLPVMLSQLRVGGDALLWVPALSAAQLLQMTQLFLLRLPLVIAILLLIADRLLPERLRHPGERTPPSAIVQDPSIAALLATILMPLVLVGITIVLEPVMVPRYAVVALLAAAPVIALGLQVSGRVGYGVVVAVFALWVVGFADKELGYARYTDGLMGEYTRQFKEMRVRYPHIPIVFNSYFNLYSVDGMSRQQSVARVMDLPDSTIAMLFPDSSQLEDKRRMLVNRGAVRLHQRGFGFPRTVAQSDMDTMPRFFLFSTDEDLPLGHQNSIEYGRALFPRHQPRRLSDIITFFERASAPSAR
jgi:hypothetical protein